MWLLRVWLLQGNTDESELTALGRVQAVRAATALADIQFDSCFSSPHTRARQTTEIVWQQFQQSAAVQDPIYLPSLSEVDLGWFQGLRNGMTCSHCTLTACRRTQLDEHTLLAFLQHVLQFACVRRCAI